MEFTELLEGTTLEPRDYQTRLVTKTIGHFNDNVHSVLITSPTGSGKSAIGLLIAKSLQQEKGIGIAWVAMRQNLLRQIAEMNQHYGMGVDIVPISMFANNVPTHDSKGRKIDLIVMDEAQHSPVSSSVHLLNTIQPRYNLGLTATPFRTDSLKLMYLKVLRDIGIRQLIQMGYLANYHHYTIPEWKVSTVVETYLREPERWGKTAIYWHKRENAIKCVDRLRAAGIKATTIFGDEPYSSREDKLAAFEDKDGKERIDVLVNMMILTEGWDCPALKTVFCRDTQKGPTVQMAGRVFRKYPGIEFKQVVQSKNTKYPMIREAEPIESYVWMEDDWRTYKLSPHIEKVAVRALHSQFNTNSEMPSYLIKKQEQARLGRRRRRGGNHDLNRLGRREEPYHHG